MMKDELLHPFRNVASKRYQRWYKTQKRRELYARARDYVWRIKSNPCLDCKGTFHPAAMTFDHVRGIKGFHAGRFTASYSKKTLDLEIAKCDLVCSNCHALRTWQRKVGLL